ncbi:MAG: DNA polymerase III subunit delta [Nautiliaceae bacterium]
MYKKDFDKLTVLPHSLLLYGNNFYLQEYEKKILKQFENANIIKMYYDDYDFETAKTHLSESSLFGDTNVLIIKHSKVLPNIEKLLKYTKDSYLFFFYYGDKKPDVFGKNFVRFFEPNLKEKLEFIETFSKEYGVKISKEASLYLASAVEPSFFRYEIEKLSLYSSDISLEDVKKLVFLYKEESFEELSVSILKGEDFYEKLNKILEISDFKRIIPAIIRYVRELFEYHVYIKKTGASSLEGYLGYKLPFHIEKQRIELAIKFKEKDFYELLKNLLKFELEMRNSEKNKEAVFWEAMSYLKIFTSF